MPPKKKKLLKLYAKVRDPKHYVLELYAARYLWNNGYRCIGFNLMLEPYCSFSVVGVKTKENPSIAVIDIYRDKTDFKNKSQDLKDLNQEEKALNDIIARLAKIYEKENKSINFKEDEIWKYLVEGFNNLKDMQNKTLYWHMLNSYRVANYHWVICYERQSKDIELPDGWGLIKLKPDTLFEGKFKPKKLYDAAYFNTTQDIENIKQTVKNKIAMALTRDVIGHDILTTENITHLFRYLSDHENMNIRDIRIERLEKSIKKSVDKRDK